MSNVRYLVFGLILVLAAACGTSDRQDAEEQPTEAQPAQEATTPDDEIAPQPGRPDGQIRATAHGPESAVNDSPVPRRQPHPRAARGWPPSR